MNFDGFMLWRYDLEKRNCLHFASQLWLELTGDRRLKILCDSFHTSQGLSVKDSIRLFRGIHRVGPRHPRSIAIMESPWGRMHIGIAIDGGIMHLIESGPAYHDISVFMTTYKNLRFYA